MKKGLPKSWAWADFGNTGGQPDHVSYSLGGLRLAEIFFGLGLKAQICYDLKKKIIFYKYIIYKILFLLD